MIDALFVRVRRYADAIDQDLKFALRSLCREWGLTATIFLTLGLGVGLNAALFTTVDRVFFRAPPEVADPGAIRRLITHTHGQHGVEYASDHFSTTDLANFQSDLRGVAEVEGTDVSTDALVGEPAERRVVAYATTGFFHLAGIRPARGRFFSPDENRYGNPHNVAVMRYDYWQDQLAGDPDILGKRIRIDSTLFTVVGIAQRGFEGMDLDVVDVWVPLASLPSTLEGPWWNGGLGIMQLFARFGSGADVFSAQTRLNARYRRDRADLVARDSTARLEAAPLLQARSALRFGSQNDRNLSLMIRLAGVGLLIAALATTSIGGLLLMRAARRRREFAIRVAVGASRARLVLSTCIESALIATLGGGFALLVALWTGGTVRRTLLSDIRWSATIIDHRVVVFTAVLALGASLLTGLAALPAVGRSDLMAALKMGGAEAGRSKSIARAALVVVQTTLCMLMLASAGVFLQSLRRIEHVDTGFDADRLITFQANRIDEGSVADVLTQIRALPTVATLSRDDMDARGGHGSPLRFANGDTLSALSAPVVNYVDSGWAHTVGQRLVAGRFISREDAARSAPVAVINESMSNAFWPGRSAIGECIAINLPKEPCRTIVGVVRDVRWDAAAPPRPMYYLPLTQVSRVSCSCRSITVRTRAVATAATVADIGRIVRSIHADPDFPLTPRLVVDRLEPIMRPWRIAAAMFLVFGLLALAAAAAGLYGLVSYDVRQRTHEFGVRLTLGATAPAILKLVVASGARVVLVGVVIGLAAALAAGRVLSALLFETSPRDPAVLGLTATTLVAVAVLASLVPAWRASRVDPVVALRAE